jgi:hypothetical protein
MKDTSWQQALFTQSAPELGNQYRDDPLLADGAARLGEAAVRLYEPGSQDFERLAAEWRKQSAQRVRDLAEAARAAIPAALAQWAAGLGAPAQVEATKRAPVLARWYWLSATLGSHSQAWPATMPPGKPTEPAMVVSRGTRRSGAWAPARAST